MPMCAYADQGLRIKAPELCSAKIGNGGNLESDTLGKLAGKCEGHGASPIIVQDAIAFKVKKANVASAKDRSELAFTNYRLPLGKEVQISFDIKLDENSSITDTWYYLLQFWQGSSHPPIAGLRINRGTSHSAMFITRGEYSKASGFTVSTHELTPGKWHHFDIKILLSKNMNGHVEITQNNSKPMSWSGKMGYSKKNKGLPWYRVKFGIYKGGEADKNFGVSFRNVEFKVDQ